MKSFDFSIKMALEYYHFFPSKCRDIVTFSRQKLWELTTDINESIQELLQHIWNT